MSKLVKLQVSITNQWLLLKQNQTFIFDKRILHEHEQIRGIASEPNKSMSFI